MSILNFLSIYIGKFRLSPLGVIKGGIGIRWFDKPRKNKEPPLGFDTQATRPAKHRCKGQISPPLSTQLVLFDLKNPTWKLYLPQKTLYLQAPLLGWASLDGCPYSQQVAGRDRETLAREVSKLVLVMVRLLLASQRRGRGVVGAGLEKEVEAFE